MPGHSRDKANEMDRRQQARQRSQAAGNADAAAQAWSFDRGRYAGVPIVCLPASYLVFMRRNHPSLETARRCTEELERRKRIKTGKKGK